MIPSRLYKRKKINQLINELIDQCAGIVEILEGIKEQVNSEEFIGKTMTTPNSNGQKDLHSNISKSYYRALQLGIPGYLIKRSMDQYFEQLDTKLKNIED